MHAFIRKMTSSDDALKNNNFNQAQNIALFKNFNTAKNDITAQKSIKCHQSKCPSFGRDNERTHQNSDTSK